MASFYKRGKSWRVSVCKFGVRDTGTFDTKAEAKEWAAKRELEIANDKKGLTGNYKTLGDAFDRYGVEVSPDKKGARWELVRLNLLRRYEFSKVLMSDLSPSDIADWRDVRLGEVSPGSVNRELNLISAVLNRAKREWRWIAENPVSEIKRPSSPRHRDRRISDDEIQRVLDALSFDGDILLKKHLVASYFLFALETAMRLGEICALGPNDVMLSERYVIIRDSKNSDSRHVPLSSRAVELIELVLASGLSINSDSASTLFKRAVAVAEIDDLRFHDSRHEALTRLARKLDVLDLARMVGHRDPRSLMIYYNPTATEIAGRLG